MTEFGALLQTGISYFGSLLYPTLALLLVSFFLVIRLAGAFCANGTNAFDSSRAGGKFCRP
jgi:hypothetical protein